MKILLTEEGFFPKRYLNLHLLPRISVCVSCLVYIFVLNWSYARVESKLFDYQGFYDNPLPLISIILSGILSILPAFWLPLRLQKPSDLAYWFLYLTFLIPVMFFPYHSLFLKFETVEILTIVVWINFMLLGLVLKIKAPKIKPFSMHKSLIYLGIFGAILCFVFLFFSKSGSHFDVSLVTQYERRMQARETIPAGSLLAYFIAIIKHSFAPLGFAVGLTKRKPLFIGLSLLGAIVVFSLDGTKDSLGIIILILLGYILTRRFKRTSGVVMALGSSVAILLIGWLYIRNGSSASIALSESFTRRLIGAKGISTMHYVEAFKDHPIYMKDSRIAGFLTGTQEKSKAFFVGEDYLGKTGTNYDANAWVSAYADFGYPGMFLASLCIGFIFLILNGMADEDNFDLCSSVGLLFAYIWGEQQFHTSLLSSGIILNLILVNCLRGIKHRPIKRKILS